MIISHSHNQTKLAQRPTEEARPETTQSSEELTRDELDQGLSNFLLVGADLHGGSAEWRLGNNLRARKAFSSLSGETHQEIKQSLNKMENRAERKGMLSLLIPAAAAFGVIGLAAGVAPLALASGVIGPGLLGAAAMVSSQREQGEVVSVQHGLEEAAKVVGKESDPEPVARDEFLNDIESAREMYVTQGDLAGIYSTEQMKARVESTSGQNSLEILKNLPEKELSPALSWFRHSRAAADGPAVPKDTKMKDVREKLVALKDQYLAEGNYNGPQSILDTISTIDDREAETWSQFVEGLLKEGEDVLRHPDKWRLQEPPRQLDTKFCAEVYNATDLKQSGRVLSRAEVLAQFDSKDQNRWLNDFPRESKVRRALKNLPGADLIEMTNQPGEKNRERSSVVLQGLIDSNREVSRKIGD